MKLRILILLTLTLASCSALNALNPTNFISGQNGIDSSVEGLGEESLAPISDADTGAVNLPSIAKLTDATLDLTSVTISFDPADTSWLQKISDYFVALAHADEETSHDEIGELVISGSTGAVYLPDADCATQECPALDQLTMIVQPSDSDVDPIEIPVNIDGSIAETRILNTYVGANFSLKLKSSEGSTSQASVKITDRDKVQTSMTVSANNKDKYALASDAQKIIFISHKLDETTYTFKSLPQTGGEETEILTENNQPLEFATSPDAKFAYLFEDGTFISYRPDHTNRLVLKDGDGYFNENFAVSSDSLAIAENSVSPEILAEAISAGSVEPVVSPLEVAADTQASLASPARTTQNLANDNAYEMDTQNMNREILASVLESYGSSSVRIISSKDDNTQKMIKLGKYYEDVNPKFTQDGKFLYVSAATKDGVDLFKWDVGANSFEKTIQLAGNFNNRQFDISKENTIATWIVSTEQYDEQIMILNLQTLESQQVTFESAIKFNTPRKMFSRDLLVAVGVTDSNDTLETEIYSISLLDGTVTCLTEAIGDTIDPQPYSDEFTLYKSVDNDGYLQINLLPVP